MPDDPRKTHERIESLLRKALTLFKRLPQPEEVQDAAASYDPASSRFHSKRYGLTRNHAVYEGDQLLGVTLYKVGAETIRDRLQAQEARIAQLTQALNGQSEASPATPGAVERLQAKRASKRIHQR